MKKREETWKALINDLTERAKELNCLYKIEEITKNIGAEPETVFKKVIDAIPAGWQYMHLCMARISYNNEVYQTKDFKETEWRQSADIIIDENSVGKIDIYYLQDASRAGGSPFLEEEQKLLDTIADRISHFIFQKKITRTIEERETAKKELEAHNKKEWRIIIELIENTDTQLFSRIARKMLNYLCRIGIEEAGNLLENIGMKKESDMFESVFVTNKPSEKKEIGSVTDWSDKIFSIASKHISDDEMMENIQKWVKEDKAGFLVKVLENLYTSLNDIFDAVSRYHYMKEKEIEITPYTRKNVIVLLIHRLFTEQLEFINIAKDYVDIEDFYEVLCRTIFPEHSHGKLGGKSAGLFIAGQILRKYEDINSDIKRIKIPKTWYITSDGLPCFLNYNNLEEILEQKYKQVKQIREEYPNIVQVFKSSNFPPEIVNWLSMALDDFEDKPIIVRSSSLLEDRMGTAFSGKYKSLFLANQGTKSDRLAALLDAVAEIYASTFAPDPIEYRKERGLIHFHEEMAVMIQDVVGTRVGKYFFPAFAGVAFSNNEFRWSPRISREDGLIRMVPGLGTRAVDRISDDYPKLIAPGQPQLKVNATVDEILHYSPHQMDVINLETNTFETIELEGLLKTYGDEYPVIEKIISVYKDNHFTTKSLFNIDFKNDDLVITFDGIITRTNFVSNTKEVLDLFKKEFNLPVDIEFACDGKDYYLLQCRPQSFFKDDLAQPIPKNIPDENIIFTANKYISNGKVSNITHIVYVDPDKYNSIETKDELRSVGRAVSRLNTLLPKKQFILMGPGRWGSRGDIKLGVNVTYSDISNTATLIEIARKKGNYVPQLSFGTHFFQDLVESSIRYIPLYPDNPDIIFNERFLSRSKNILSQMLPEYSGLQDVITVVDIPEETGGNIMQILMNAELDEAMACITAPSVVFTSKESDKIYAEDHPSDCWQWRMRMAEFIAKALEADRFGVKALYIMGSTKNATASPGSDIDLLVHFNGNDKQKRELLIWFEGWSLCLAEINYLKTGYRTKGLLDIHLITDEDIAKKTSYALKINAVTDPAHPLKVNY